MPRDSIAHTLKVTIILCVVCSVAVSLAAVGLRDLQNANRLEERNRNILIASELREQDDAWIVSLTAKNPAQQTRLCGEFSNFALGLTIQRGGSE